MTSIPLTEVAGYGLMGDWDSDAVVTCPHEDCWWNGPKVGTIAEALAAAGVHELETDHGPERDETPATRR